MPKREVCEISKDWTEEQWQGYEEHCEEKKREMAERRGAYYHRYWFAFEIRLPEAWISRPHSQRLIRERGVLTHKGKNVWTISCPIEKDVDFLIGWMGMFRLGMRNRSKLAKQYGRKNGRIGLTPRSMFIGKRLGKVMGKGYKDMMDKMGF